MEVKKPAKWRIIPRVSYHNWAKDGSPAIMRAKWFEVRKFWQGRLIQIQVKQHQLTFDFRSNWVLDMVDPR